jgi:catechol-2,3-dioxygenase
VVGVTDHTIFKSIYFFDPNGHRLELAANTATPDMYRKLDEVKWDMLEEWSKHQARAQARRLDARERIRLSSKARGQGLRVASSISTL